MKNVVNTIEDLLEILAGLQGQSKIQIESSDVTIMHSIARQTFKGTALTDRQFALMQEKLLKYKDQFTALEYDFERALNSLRLPLRNIDRSKYIKIVDYPEDMPYASEDKGKFIKVRFPFKKSDIMLINEINSTQDYYHNKGSHEHYFALTEKNLYSIVSRFKEKDYKIDKELLELYEKVVKIQNNKKEYVCGVFDNQLLNLHPDIEKLAKEEVGEYSKDTELFYIDRKFRYCINHVDPKETIFLKEKIAYRSNVTYQSKPSKETLSDVLLSLWELKRLPMLVVLDRTNAEQQLYEMISFYRDILPTEEQSVLFRQEGTSEFNQLVKDRKLNNWVDSNTKLVYISSNNLPKLLLKDNWSTCTAFCYTSSLDRTVNTFIENRCDLIVYREEEISPLRRYSRIYG